MAIHNISEHQFPPSPQSDLFNYLRLEQQEFVKPILRVLKKPAQEELCVALIDYLETGIPEPPVTFNLGVIFMYVIHGCEPKGDNPEDRKFLYPLRSDVRFRTDANDRVCTKTTFSPSNNRSSRILCNITIHSL